MDNDNGAFLFEIFVYSHTLDISVKARLTVFQF